jgi:hypothetical protein
MTRTIDPAARRNMQRLEQATKVMRLFAALALMLCCALSSSPYSRRPGGG